MKRYGICLFLCLVFVWIGFEIGYLVSASEQTMEHEQVEETLGEEQEMVLEAAEQQVQVSKQQYYLVSETGFLLVFAQDQSTICLYTHIPLTEFPEEEQDRLREGIWFSSMMEIFHYLESYTS